MRGRTVGGLAVLVVVGWLLVGCTANSGSSSGVATEHAAGLVPQQGVPQQKQATGGTAGSSGGAAAPNQPPPGTTAIAGPSRQVIRTASISLTVTNVPDTASRATGIAEAAGGWTGSEDATDSRATLTLQVPEEKVDSVLHDLGGLGHVTDQGASSQDVTDQLVDVHSRIASQQASVDRVRALLAQATSISDIVSIEGDLTQRESDLESLEQRAAELSGQVAMSAITVSLTPAVPVAAPPPAQQAGFVGGLSAGWHAFVAALGVLLVIVGAVAPFAVVLGVPAFAVWWLLRRRRRAQARPDPGPVPDAG
jgi:Domain of unknown function (DUF4349)